MYILTSDITIGKFRFSGVHAVTIRRSIHGIEETAVITIPAVAKIVSKGKVQPGSVITGRQFKEGDAVTIRLGYNGDLKTEFKGFVKHCSLKMPLEITCEGYSWLLRRNKIKEMSGMISLKDVLANAIANLPDGNKITVQCDADIQLNNVQFKNESGFDVLNGVGKYADGSLSIFFIRPDTLWCGLLYSGIAEGRNLLQTPQVKFRPGYNLVRENSLQPIAVNNNPVQVSYSNKHADGTRVVQSSDAFKSYVKTHNKVLTQIKEAPVLKKLANEKAHKLNPAGYDGYLTSFLQPFAEPGYSAYIADSRYPELTGTYLIESTEVTFGVTGARRHVEIGPRINS